MIESVDSDRLRFLGFVLEAYFCWRSDPDRLGFPEWGRVIRMPEAIENRRVINLSDDEFTRVDSAYASCRDELSPRYSLGSSPLVTIKDLIEIEYSHSGSTKQKARRLGYQGDNYSALVGHYRADVRAAESRLYVELMPDVEQWENQNFERLGELERQT